MPSRRSRILDTVLRLTVKRSWREDMPVATIRKRMDLAAAGLGAGAGEAAAVDTPRVPMCRVNVAGHQGSRTLFYLHGGAFCWHSPTLYSGFVTRVCQQIDAVGYFPDYRLAPEHPFPAAVQDCLEAYQWLLEQDVDPKRLVIAGDSAGGCLVMTTLQQARDQGLPLPACAVALSPATDLTATSGSFHDNASADAMFTADALKLFRRLYVPAGISLSDPLVSPLYGDFHGLPPMLLHVGDTEILRDDSLRVVEKVRQAGGEAQVDVWQGLPHVFHAVPWLPEAAVALARMAYFVKAQVP